MTLCDASPLIALINKGDSNHARCVTMEARADFKTRFKSQGIGIKSKQQPISVMYPADIDALLRSLPNRSEFIRDAVMEKLQKEGLLSEREPLAAGGSL